MHMLKATKKITDLAQRVLLLSEDYDYTALTLSPLFDCTFILPITAHPCYLGLLLLPSRAVLKVPTLVYFPSPCFDLKTPFYMLMLLVANWSKLLTMIFGMHYLFLEIYVKSYQCTCCQTGKWYPRASISETLNKILKGWDISWYGTNKLHASHFCCAKHRL